MADPSVTERSYPFTSGQGANVTQDDWSAMAGPWQDSGVYSIPGGTGLTVQPGPTQNTIQINPGTATIGGFSYRLTAAKVLSTLPNPGGSSRVDLVVLALDTVGQTILPQVVTSATVASVAAGSIPLAEWTQLTNATATSSNWGSAVDKRWLAGHRVRQALVGVDPPPEVGAMLFHPADGATAAFKIGVLVSGVPAWANWVPWGTTGAVVGTTDVQTLTNKTLTSPTITGGTQTSPTINTPTITGASMSGTTLTSPTIASFVNATHTHSNAAGGGLITSAPTVSATGGALATLTGTYTNIPNLTFSVLAGVTYRFEGYVIWRSTGGTGTVMVGVGGTCTATFLAYRSNLATAATGGSSSFVHNQMVSGITGFSSVGVASTDLAIAVNGLIVVNAAGTLTLAAAQGAASATISAGGKFVLERVS